MDKPFKFCIHWSVVCAQTVNMMAKPYFTLVLFLLVLMGEMLPTNTSSMLAELEGTSSEIYTSHCALCGNKNTHALN